MRFSQGFFLALVIVCVIGPVAAQTTNISSSNMITASNVRFYSASATPGDVIYEIIVNDIPIGTNQTHILNQNGASFALSINSASSYGGLYDQFWINMTLPNGTVESSYIDSWRLSGGVYKTTIQPVFSQLQSFTIEYWTVDLQVGLTPVSAQFNSPPAAFNAETSIPFSSVSGTIGTSTNVYIYQMSLTDFQNNVVNYNPVYGIQNLGSQVFQWAWSTVLGFINTIPIIGPLFVGLISTVAAGAAWLVFWIGFLISNLPLIIVGGETLLGIMAVIMAGKKPKPEKVLKNLVDYNIAAVKGGFAMLDLSYVWLREFVSMVARVVRALVPI